MVGDVVTWCCKNCCRYQLMHQGKILQKLDGPIVEVLYPM